MKAAPIFARLGAIVVVACTLLTFFLLFRIIIIVIIRTGKEQEPFADDDDKNPVPPVPVPGKEQEKSKFAVLTYENDSENENSSFYFKQLNVNGYAFENMGIGEIWTGWHARLLKYTEYLESLQDQDSFVAITDARDVLVNNVSSDTFFEKAMGIYENGKIIVSTERYCCDTGAIHDDFYISSMITDKDKDVKHTEVYKKFMREQAYRYDSNYKSDLYYLNFGLMFGKARDFLEVFRLMKMKPGLDDQLLLQKVFYENPDLIRPDINHVILSTAGSGGRECYYQWDESVQRFQNNATEEYPCFLHAAGNFWSCYHKMKGKLVNSA